MTLIHWGTTSGHVAPRIAEFPRTTSFEYRKYAKQTLDSVPLSALHAWVAHEFGEGERAGVEGLPVSVIASLYPEAEQTAFFSMVRETPQLEELQEFFDGLAKSMPLDNSPALDELNKLRNWSRKKGLRNALADEPIAESFFVQSPEFLEGFSGDMKWALQFILHRDKPWTPSDNAWLYFRNLAMFVCAPQVVDPNYRDGYAAAVPSYEGLMKALGLGELWLTASTRVDAWREGDDDD